MRLRTGTTATDTKAVATPAAAKTTANCRRMSPWTPPISSRTREKSDTTAPAVRTGTRVSARCPEQQADMTTAGNPIMKTSADVSA